MRARTARRGLLDKAPYDGMSAIGTLGGERGAKRGQHPGRPLPRLDGPVGLRRLVHGVQVAAHRRQRPLVLVAAEALDEAGVAHAQAQEEPVGVGLGEGELGGRHCERVPRLDVGDAGCDDHALGCGEQDGGGGERFPVERLADPERSIAELGGSSRGRPEATRWPALRM
jgi:hypothetical protein